jgi:hypothetical protein
MEIYLLEKVILELLTTIGGNQQEIPVEMMKIKTKWPQWEVGEVDLPWAVAALGVDGGQVLLHLVEGGTLRQVQKDQLVVGVAQPEVGFHLPEVAAAGAAGLTNVDFQPQTEISKTEEGPHPVGIGNPRMNPMPIPDPEVVAILVGARVGARADQLIIVIVRDKIQITICLNGLVRTFLVWTNLVEDLIPVGNLVAMSINPSRE